MFRYFMGYQLQHIKPDFLLKLFYIMDPTGQMNIEHCEDV